MKKQINKPIFFIGVPRSGTTIIFEIFSVHEELSWISNHYELFPKTPLISSIARISNHVWFRGAKKQFSKQSWLKNVLPFPAESYKLWESCCGKKFLYDYLNDKYATDDEITKTRKMISQVMFFQGKERFAAKHTGPARITYLNSIFPNAIFIHIVRDGRAVVNSLMNAGFWKERGGYDKPWWKNGLTGEDFKLLNKYRQSPIVLAAVQWRRIIRLARDEAMKISANRYYEMRYEDFINDPYKNLRTLTDISKLKKSKKVCEYLRKHVKLKNQNYKYLNIFNKSEIKILNDIMRDTLVQLNYNVSDI